MRQLPIVLGLLLCLPQIANAAPDVDVTHYSVRLRPDMETKSVTGHAEITVVVRDATTVRFDAGALEIDRVDENGTALSFVKEGERLAIDLPGGGIHHVGIDYHGTPSKGVRFFPDAGQVYAGFATSQWMPCIDAPDERATLDLTLEVEKGLKVVASGELESEETLADGRVASHWSLKEPMPSYLYGFAVGHFREVIDDSAKPTLRFLAPESFSETDIRRVFALTRDMIAFYEEKSGHAYPAAVYTHALLEGRPAQELADFTELRESYGKQVLEDATKVWLGAHELQHQWWGNRVTNKAWTEFWLNEGIGTFMTEAYIEHRFGHAAYMKDIDAYKANYEKLRAAGQDKPLVFPDWDHPTPEDRSIVYDKGAYVVFLLRQELGDKAFWAGIKRYTEDNWGKSVTTSDFQLAMQQASGTNLDDFFARWVYMTR